MTGHRLEDHETPTPEAAAGFERYQAMGDWDEAVEASDVRLDEDSWADYYKRLRGGDQ
jgi:hypothetical protein